MGYQPRQLFHPRQISDHLADADPDAAKVTPEQATRVGDTLAGMLDDDLAQAFERAGLRGVQLARAWWWVRHVRARAGWADQALRWLTGDPAFALDGEQKHRLIRLLLGAGGSTRERRAALLLVGFSKDPELEKMAGWLLGRLEAVIPAGSANRGRLEQVLQERLDEAGRVMPGVEPRVPFTFGRISPDLSPDLAGISFARAAKPSSPRCSTCHAPSARSPNGSWATSASRWTTTAKPARTAPSL